MVMHSCLVPLERGLNCGLFQEFSKRVKNIVSNYLVATCVDKGHLVHPP